MDISCTVIEYSYLVDLYITTAEMMALFYISSEIISPDYLRFPYRFSQ